MSTGVSSRSKLNQRALLDAAVGAGHDAGEIRVGLLDRPHRVVQRPAQVGAFGERREPGEASLRRQENDALADVVLCRDLLLVPAARLQRSHRTDPPLSLGEPLLGVAKEQEPQDRPRVFRGHQVRVGTQLVRRRPQPPLELCNVRGHARHSRYRGAFSCDALVRGCRGLTARFSRLVAVREQDRELIRNDEGVDHRFAARAPAARPVTACATYREKLVFGEAIQKASDVLFVHHSPQERAPPMQKLKDLAPDRANRFIVSAHSRRHRLPGKRR